MVSLRKDLLFGTIAVGILGAIFFFSYFNNRENATKNTFSYDQIPLSNPGTIPGFVEPSPPSPVLKSLEYTPTFYKNDELVWEKEERYTWEAAVYYDNGNASFVNTNWLNGSHSLAGTKWTAKKSFSRAQDLFPTDYKDSFRYYTVDELTRHGWLQDVEINNFRISPLFADGFNGSVWGGIGYINGNVRVVLFDETREGKEIITSEGIGGLECPCTQAFSVFISDIVPLRTIIPQ